MTEVFSYATQEIDTLKYRLKKFQLINRYVTVIISIVSLLFLVTYTLSLFYMPFRFQPKLTITYFTLMASVLAIVIVFLNFMQSTLKLRIENIEQKNNINERIRHKTSSSGNSTNGEKNNKPNVTYDKSIDNDIYSGRESNYFDELVTINIENLSSYYTFVKESTEKSFYVSIIVGIIGFILLIVALIINMNNAKEISYIIGGSSLITEFISGIFFYLYNKTVRQMKEYHDKLVFVQNILLSYKLIQDTKEVELKSKIIEMVVSNITSNHNKEI